MNSKWLALIISIFMILVMAISACAAPAATPAPSQSTTPTPAPAPTVQPMKLKLGYNAAPIAYYARAADWWAAEIAKATKGRISFEIYPSDSLVKPADAIESINGGLIDAYVLSTSQLPGVFPANNLFILPGTSFPTSLEGKIATCENAEQLIQKHPVLANEFKGLQLMYANPGPTFYVISRNKEIHTPADIVGLKVGALGARIAYLKLFGAAPASNPPPQAYQMLQTGVVDAFAMPWNAIIDYQLWEVVKNLSDVDLGESALMTIMGDNVWNKISPDDQKMIKEISSQARVKSAENIMEETGRAIDKFLDYGCKIIELTPQERALWSEKSKIFWDSWIADNEAKGLKGIRDAFNERLAAREAAYSK